MHERMRATFDEHISVVTAARDELLADLEATVRMLMATIEAGGTILVAGNGGSSSDALHFVAELVGRFEADRAPIRAVALGVDVPTLTAISNDLDFTEVIPRQLEALARPGDLFLGISTSGTSPNIVRAATTARSLGCTVVGLTGDGGGDLGEACNLFVAVPSTNTARIQEVHSVCLHAVAALVEKELFCET